MCPKLSLQECQPLKIKKVFSPRTGGQYFQIFQCSIAIPCCPFLTLLNALQLCDGTYDCPQTEISVGGEDEDSCAEGDTIKHFK